MLQHDVSAKFPVRLFPALWNTHQFIIDPTKFTVEDVLSAKFFSQLNNPNALRVMDIIHATAADHSWDVEARLTMKKAGEMKFSILRLTKSEAVIAPLVESKEFKVQHYGPGRFRVVENITGKIVAEGLDREAAEAECARLDATRDVKAACRLLGAPEMPSPDYPYILSRLRA